MNICISAKNTNIIIYINRVAQSSWVITLHSNIRHSALKGGIFIGMQDIRSKFKTKIFCVLLELQRKCISCICEMFQKKRHFLCSYNLVISPLKLHFDIFYMILEMAVPTRFAIILLIVLTMYITTTGNIESFLFVPYYYLVMHWFPEEHFWVLFAQLLFHPSATTTPFYEN